MITVGQKLWYVPNSARRGQPKEVTVVKVGRRWATLDDYSGRVDIETLAVDGGEYMSPAQCFLSREDYETSVAISDLWKDTYRRIGYSVPPHLTLEALKEIRRLLALPEVEAKT